MAYIVQRNHRFYVVAYDGIDPLTGRIVAAGIPPVAAATMPRRSSPSWRSIARVLVNERPRE